MNVGMNGVTVSHHYGYSGVFNGSLASMVWLADSLAGIVEGVGGRKKTLCIIITRNKRPAIHIPGQTLHPEPFMSHAMIFSLKEVYLERLLRS